MGPFNQLLKKFTFFQHSQTFYDVMQEEIGNIEFVQGVNFELIDSLKKQRYKKLFNLCRFMWRELQFKSFFWHCYCWQTSWSGLSTFYIKQNLFHQSKLGREFDLQNSHIVLFKSPRDVMQVSTLRPQLGLWSELVDCYRDATSVHYGHFLIDLSLRTDDRLRYCTNTESFPSIFNTPDRFKQLKI